MKFLKQYRFVLLIFLLLVVLVLFRSFSRTGFRYDAARWAEASVDGSNLLTVDRLSAITGEIMLLNLGSEADLPGELQNKALTVSPESITGRENLKQIRKHKGPVILYSANGSVSARVWMVLSEMGMKNIYILSVPGSEAE
jgi:rhodanese-related sulfurtransferase